MLKAGAGASSSCPRVTFVGLVNLPQLQQLRTEAQMHKLAQETLSSQMTEHKAGLKRKRDELTQLKVEHKESEKERVKLQRGHDKLLALQKEHTALQDKFQQLQHEHSKAQAAATVEHNKLEISIGVQEEHAKELKAELAHVKSQLAKQTNEVARYKKAFQGLPGL